MNHRGTPTFNGWQALLLAGQDSHTQRLERQLGLLGVQVRRQAVALAVDDLPELVILDADQNQDGLLPWPEGQPARPVVALLGSEAPGRIAWALRQGAGAFIAKPVSAAVVYPALVLALSRHEERMQAARRIAHLDERLKLRPVVFAAVARLKTERGLSDEQAWAWLRASAMRRRVSMESLAALMLDGTQSWREAG